VHLCSFLRLARVFFSVSTRNSTSRQSSRSRSRRRARRSGSLQWIRTIGSNSSVTTALEISTHFVRSIYHYRPYVSPRKHRLTRRPTAQSGNFEIAIVLQSELLSPSLSLSSRIIAESPIARIKRRLES